MAKPAHIFMFLHMFVKKTLVFKLVSTCFTRYRNSIHARFYMFHAIIIFGVFFIAVWTRISDPLVFDIDVLLKCRF